MGATVHSALANLTRLSQETSGILPRSYCCLRRFRCVKQLTLLRFEAPCRSAEKLYCRRSEHFAFGIVRSWLRISSHLHRRAHSIVFLLWLCRVSTTMGDGSYHRPVCGVLRNLNRRLRRLAAGWNCSSSVEPGSARMRRLTRRDGVCHVVEIASTDKSLVLYRAVSNSLGEFEFALLQLGIGRHARLGVLGARAQTWRDSSAWNPASVTNWKRYPMFRKLALELRDLPLVQFGFPMERRRAIVGQEFARELRVNCAWQIGALPPMFGSEVSHQSMSAYGA